MEINTLEHNRDEGKFLSLREIVSLGYEGKSSENRENQALLILRKRAGALEQLETFLSDHGYRKLRPYGWGSNAFLGYSTQGQLVRISPIGYDLPLGTEADRPDCPRVLGHIECHKIYDPKNTSLGWKIEILNEVKNAVSDYKVMLEDYNNLRIMLAKLGWYVWDPKPENVRRLSDGTPIFVDPDTVRAPDRGDDKEESSVRYYATLPPPPYYWGERGDRSTWKQVQEFPQLNPSSKFYKKVLGVIDAEQLKVVEKTVGDKSSLACAIRDEGLYPDQLNPELKSQLEQLLPEAFMSVGDEKITAAKRR